MLSTIFHGLTARFQSLTGHPAEHGIDFDVVVAALVHSNPGLISRPFSLSCSRWRTSAGAKKGEHNNKARSHRNLYFADVSPRVEAQTGQRVGRPARALF